MHRTKRRGNLTTGNRTLLVVSITAALAAMASMTVQASTTLSGDTTLSSPTTNVTWTGGGGMFLVNSGIVVSGTPALIVNVTGGTVTNNGTITGSTFGISNTGTISTLNNNDGATITGAQAISNSGTIGTINNGTMGTIGGITGIYNVGQFGRLTNHGTIEATSQNGIWNGVGGTITLLENDANAFIGGTTNVRGVGNLGSIVTLNNYGTISAQAIGLLSNVYLGTLSNSGLITAQTGIYGGSGGLIGTISNTGSITGTTTGVSIAGSLGTLSNSNLISGNYGLSNSGSIGTILNDIGGLIRGDTDAVHNGATLFGNTYAGTIALLDNRGTISVGSISGAAIYNGATSTIARLQNESTGAILNSSGNAIYNGAANGTLSAAGIGTLSNAGLISGGLDGIGNQGGIGILANNIGGTISGGGAGINNTGQIASLNNSGAISGNTGIKNTGQITALTNSGTITGSAYGMNISSGTIGTLNNSGLISGGNRALLITAGNLLSNIVNTGVIAGLVECDCSILGDPKLTITGGAIGSNVFGTLTGASGGIGAGDVSLIASANGIVLNGNQLLNDGLNALNGGVTNNGVLQVNNAVTISGSYVQGSGATLVIGVVTPGNGNAGNLNDIGYGRLVVRNGGATLDNSSVVVKSAGYSLAQGQRYVVLATDRTLSANNVTYSAAGFTATGAIQTDTSDPGFQDLVVILSANLAPGNSRPINYASNGNAAAALNGLFNYSGTNAGLLSVFNPAVALGNADAANKAGAQLSPAAVNGAAVRSVDASSQAVGNVISSHLDGVRLAQGGNGGSGIATGESARDVALWGQFFDGHASQGMRDGISGYHGDYHGLLIGADAQASDALRVGGAFSAARTTVAADDNNTGSSARANNYGLTAYGTYTGSPWYINALAGISRQQYGTVRNVGFTGFSGINNGSFNGHQYTAAVQAGYPLNLDAWMPGATLTPLLGLSYTHQRVNGYTESGGASALTVGATSGSSLKSELGAKLERGFHTSCGKLLPAVELGWRHEFRNDRMQTGARFTADSTGSTAFVTQSATPVSNVGVLGLGVTLLKSDQLSLNVKYTLESGGGYLAQTGSVQVRWNY